MKSVFLTILFFDSAVGSAVTVYGSALYSTCRDYIMKDKKYAKFDTFKSYDTFKHECRKAYTSFIGSQERE